MQIPDDFWRVEDVSFRTDERHTAVLSVHQQLSTEMLAEQVTSRLITDSTMDAWHDPYSVAALQILHHTSQCTHKLSLTQALSSRVTWHSSGYGIRLVTWWSRVWAPAAALSCNNLGQVVHTRVPLSPSSMTWYQRKLGHTPAHHAMQ